jgi:hypothetical protein
MEMKTAIIMNNFRMKYPELAAQWHPELNGNVTPNMVSASSRTKYWWLLPYDDSITGKHFDFVWSASPLERIRAKGASCPFLCGKAVWQGFNDLATHHPELAMEWHPTKNGTLKPSDVTCGKNLKVWWYLPYDDLETGKHFDFEWKAWIRDRVKGVKCPYLTGNAVYPGYNDLATKYPELAMQWHPINNGRLKTTDITSNCHKKVWWCFPYDDPITGKHFDFEWTASPNARILNNGCPFLSGKAVCPGFNDLESRYPEVAMQWHPIKNGTLLPSQVCYSSNKSYYWLLPYDDPVTGKHFDFVWKAKVENRTLLGEGCPYLGNDKVYEGYNDLTTRFPEIAKEWHPSKNGRLKPESVVYGSSAQIWWLLHYVDPSTGKEFAFEWKAPINIRTGVGTNDGRRAGCPYLAPNPKVWTGFNDLATWYPEIAAEFHPTKNRKKTAADVYKCTPKKFWWKCSRCGQEWYSSVKDRVYQGALCAKCRKRLIHSN